MTAPVGFSFQRFLDCSGPEYSSEWTYFYDALSKSPVSEESHEMASRLVGKWRNRTKLMLKYLPSVLLGEVSPRAFPGVCVHGYCAAVDLQARLTPRGSHDAGHFAVLREVERCVGWEGEWPTYSFLGDSRWGAIYTQPNLNWDLLRLTRPGLVRRAPPRRRPLLQASKSLHGSEGSTSGSSSSSSSTSPGRQSSTSSSSSSSSPSSALLSRGLSTDRYLHEYRRQLAPALAVLFPHPSPPAGERLAKSKTSLSLAAFGVHLTTLLEPISAMRQVLPKEFKMTSVFYGSTHPLPEMLVPDVCPSGSLAYKHGFECFISETPSDKFWMEVTSMSSIHKAISVLGGVFWLNDFLQEVDCLVCGGGHAPTLCLLLRMVSDRPMFLNLQASLTFRMPTDPDVRALLVNYFRQLAQPGYQALTTGRTVVSTSLIFFQRQYWVQTGILLPIVRNHNWYVREGLRGLTPSVEKENEVLFWQNHISLRAPYALILWRLVSQTVPSDLRYNFVFKNMAKLPQAGKGRKVYGLSEVESAMLSYRSMTERFVAAVIFPHDLGMISFDDLYALGIPIYLPTNELIVSMATAHLVSGRNYPWYMLREEHAELSAFAFERRPMPWDPGWQGEAALNTTTGRSVYFGHGLKDNPELIASAVSISNFALLPHVSRFRSIAGLMEDLTQLSPEDFAAIGKAMRKSSLEAWETTSEFYQRSLSFLLDPQR